jgi:predicted transcriptional regulator
MSVMLNEDINLYILLASALNIKVGTYSFDITMYKIFRMKVDESIKDLAELGVINLSYFPSLPIS